MAIVDILLPTCDRLSSLIFTLSGVATQSLTDLHVILADQSLEPVINSPVIQTLLRIIDSRGGTHSYYHRLPSQGIAEQREFLLQQARADAVLYLDDDVFMEPWVVERLLTTLQTEQCGFVGAFPTGLSYRADIRPQQQPVEFWQGAVTPEIVQPDSPIWERFHLHRAANLYHVSQTLAPGEFRRYKIAWVACCILYERSKLLQVGGFSFWERLPRYHSGEEVLVQNLLMRRWGGCAIMPSGTYHAEVPSTVLNSQGTVDGHALDLLPEMIARYAPETLEV
ncbi:glycosyltransferase family 2 protein [Pantanalinema sp. GBBB05]|uniref:glycosyltransferase family 2 protein n=1 Tax=Pantanalinema sp. GBBB05 TaxID=2604139 RepID=UPI001D9EECE2|nr:glycosyltransferase family 2 protein [Pantanalinema sp. GBBB05]